MCSYATDVDERNKIVHYPIMTTVTDGRVPADTLPHRLVLLRLEMGWSQREAAIATGVTYGEWQSMEAGRAARDIPRKVALIAEATGFSRDWLMWGGPLVPTDPTDPFHVHGGRLSVSKSRNRRHSVYISGDCLLAVA